MRLQRNNLARAVTQSISTYWDKPGAAITEIHRGLLTAGVRISDPVISFNDKRDDRATYDLEDRDTGEPIENSMLVSTGDWRSETRCEVASYLPRHSPRGTAQHI